MRGEVSKQVGLSARVREVLMDEAEPFFVRRRTTDGKEVVSLAGESDAGSLAELNAVLEDVLAGEPREVIVDLARATFVDSMTLGALMAAATRVRSVGGSFSVVGAGAREVRRAFEVTGLDKYLLSS